MSFTRRDQFSLCEAYTSIYHENAGKNVDITQDQAAALVALVAKAVDGDPEAIKIVTGKATAELEQAIKQQAPSGKPVNEAFERLRAKYGSKLMGDDPIRRRYDLFLKDVNGHLWEVKQDARKLNVEPEMVDGFISNIISIEPAVQEKGKLLQKIGYGAGSIVGRFAFVTPFVAAASFLGPLVGATGLAIPAISAALAGGGQTAIMLTNKQLTRKEKILNVVATMVSAFGLSKAAESMLSEIPPPKPTDGGGSGGGYSGDGKIGFDYDPIDPNEGGFNPVEVSPPRPSGISDGGFGAKEFPKLHNTAFDSVSTLDQTKQAIADILRAKGITGSSGGLEGIASPRIMNAMDMAGINTSGEYTRVLKGMKALSTETLKAMQNDTNYAIKILKSFNK